MTSSYVNTESHLEIRQSLKLVRFSLKKKDLSKKNQLRVGQ